VVHRDFRFSEVRLLEIMDSESYYGLEILDPVEKISDCERFPSLASDLVSPRFEINSSIDADKAARDLAASIASAVDRNNYNFG
jgi:hypothetical protein